MANIFEAIGVDEDPLGLWAPAASTAESALGAVSFSVGGDDASSEAIEPVYRVHLPADDDSAAQALAAREGYIRDLNAALENVPARLDGLVARTQERQKKAAASGVSFDVLSLEQPESGPEGDLLTLLDEAEASGKTGSGEVSFGLQETTSAAWQQAKVGFDALIQQINREVLHFAWVETNIADALIARTTVGWTGDSQTAFVNGVDDAQVALHQRTLSIVSQTRSMRLRLFITIASGATKVSALIATPAGAVFALPAVYQYVMQIVAQVKQLEPQTP